MSVPNLDRGNKYSRIRAVFTVLALALMVAAALVAPEPPRRHAGEAPKSALYGEYTDWREVNEIFPKYGQAGVVDFATGQKFTVQRRGGTYHADVQPLTAGDTAVMKSIYGDSWSWRRRAVLVQVGGRWIAGSMNGMPHGGGLIQGNNFPGHFCIHFRGSRLHLNGREDLGHRLMTCKAAGILEEMMQNSPAGEMVKIFFTALDNRDLALAVRAAYFDRPGQLPDLYNKAEQINSVKVLRAAGANGGPVAVSLAVIYKGNNQIFNKSGRINTVYHSYAGWRVDYPSVENLLAQAEGPALPALAPDQGEDLD